MMRKDPNDRYYGVTYRVVELKSGRNRVDPISTDGSGHHPSIAMSESGSALYVATRSGFRGIELPSGIDICRFDLTGDEAVLHSGFTYEVRLSPDGSTVVLGLDIWIGLFNAKTGQFSGSKAAGRLTTGHREDMACTSDGNFVFFAGLTDGAGVWDMRTGRRIQSFDLRQSSSVRLSPDEKTLAVTYSGLGTKRDGITQIWRVSQH